VTHALRAFMEELIDYAGLFPPAGLDMPAAVAAYAAHRMEPEAWMLNRFIAPAESLPAFLEAARPHLAAAGRPWSLSVLVGARDDAHVAVSRTEPQADAIAALEDGSGGGALVDALETPVPGPAAGAGCLTFLDRLFDALAEAGLGGRDVAVEVPAGADDEVVMRAIATAAVRHGAPDGEFGRIAAKLRCGGLVADAFPSTARLARVIALAGDLGLPLKFTAGLHHPVRHRADEPDVMMHGFVNVFGAAILSREGGLAGDELEACLAETDPGAFAFTDEGFAWRDRSVATVAIARCREAWLPGFGSCSFLEPRDDLAALGLL
jgi:hypothetical protein